MKIRTSVPFVDTNIIPDRNAGIGSLLLDLQNSQNPDWDGPPLLEREFAFIDLGASRAKVSTVLKTLLASDLKMEVDYVATERPEAVPYAHVTPLGSRGKKIRGGLSPMISSQGSAREVVDWHFTVDHRGKVASISYRYDLHGNEIWEAYFMGGPFLYAGKTIEFSNLELDALLAPEVAEIEARIDQERKGDFDPLAPAVSWDGYLMKKHPLEASLAASGIALQKTDVPQRISRRQNVLFLGNVLNHYPQDEQSHELDRISGDLEHGDLVIVQNDEVETPAIEVLQVIRLEERKALQRVRWINTKTLDVHLRAGGPDGWRRINLKPEVLRVANQVRKQLAEQGAFPQCDQEARQELIQRYFSHVFATYLRATPVPEVVRVATREALRRLSWGKGPNGTPNKQDPSESAGRSRVVSRARSNGLIGAPASLQAMPRAKSVDFKMSRQQIESHQSIST